MTPRTRDRVEVALFYPFRLIMQAVGFIVIFGIYKPLYERYAKEKK